MMLPVAALFGIKSDLMPHMSAMPPGVLVVLIALCESMPTSHWWQLLRLISWMDILIGVTSLAGGGPGCGRVLGEVVAVYGV